MDMCDIMALEIDAARLWRLTPVWRSKDSARALGALAGSFAGVPAPYPLRAMLSPWRP